MTISKTDLDAWIEREADRILYPHVDRRPFNLGAQLVVPLLLQAVEALKLPEMDCGDNSCRFADRSKPMGMRTNGGCRCTDKSDSRIKIMRFLLNSKEALSQIETAVKGGIK